MSGIIYVRNLKRVDVRNLNRVLILKVVMMLELLRAFLFFHQWTHRRPSSPTVVRRPLLYSNKSNSYNPAGPKPEGFIPV